jgi:hypothetical protein
MVNNNQVVKRTAIPDDFGFDREDNGPIEQKPPKRKNSSEESDGEQANWTETCAT